MPNDRTVRFTNVKAKRETAKALLCEFPDGEDRWVPQSQIDSDSEVYKMGDEGDLVTTEWWAVNAEVEDLADAE